MLNFLKPLLLTFFDVINDSRMVWLVLAIAISIMLGAAYFQKRNADMTYQRDIAMAIANTSKPGGPVSVKVCHIVNGRCTLIVFGSDLGKPQLIDSIINQYCGAMPDVRRGLEEYRCNDQVLVTRPLPGSQYGGAIN